MTLYILDTDHLSLYQREKGEHESISANIRAFPPASITITVISVEEQMRGRLAQISRAKKVPDRLQAYWWLRKTAIALNRFPILAFDEAAQLRFEHLKSLKLRVGTQDLRIAAIALATQCVLVMRNLQDFMAVPGLTLADWSRSPV